MKEKKELSFQDFIVGLTIAVEFFQFTAMGPDYRPINDFLANIGDALSLDLDNFIRMNSGVFWVISDIVLVCSLLWIVLCLVVLYRLDERLERFIIFQYLGRSADILMPILGNLCFIPFVSVLLDTFVCDESIGNEFSDSFLAKDCHQFCWQGSHIIYAILSLIALITYEPLAVFCRPLWQELQSLLHVKALPLYLMIKTVVQITLIVMNKTVKRADAVIHGFLFIGVLIAFLIFICRFKPYNYPRFNWWQAVSIFGVIWLSFLSTVNLINEDKTFPWVAIVFAGWAVIAIVGLIVQKMKYPSLLYRKKGRDTNTLFKFAFRFGKNTGKSIQNFHASSVSPGTLSKDWPN